ncbi:unnamed protein product [Cyprideis torosa]|uniref:Uncharacterized protein n=1 Tax=Cyprideis torosa TaxID=163714 RepID=A0A7R8ZK70_9CRUS|nr:unnamed protein product [Cyprideis torosa]CAG0888686.1 unnamed protein product [Cyprideis torosa]
MRFILCLLIVLCPESALQADASATSAHKRSVRGRGYQNIYFRDKCNKTIDVYEEITSPEVTRENRNRPLSCWYNFRPFRSTDPKQWVISIRFKRFKVGHLLNDSYCAGGYLRVSRKYNVKPRGGKKIGPFLLNDSYCAGGYLRVGVEEGAQLQRLEWRRELNFRGWSVRGISTSEVGVEEGAQLQRLECKRELNFRGWSGGGSSTSEVGVEEIKPSEDKT